MKLNRVFAAIEAAVNSSTNQYARNHLNDISVHTHGYAEPGYDGMIIATGNWNRAGETWDQSKGKFIGGDDTPTRLHAVLEKLGVKTEWSDEWTSCDNCCKLVRTVGDSYHWRPSYAITNESIYCQECLKLDAKTYLESLEGRSNTCCPVDIYPSEHNYVLAGQYEHGFHPGQNDNPKKIAASLRSQGVTRFLFTLDQNNQFDQRFSLWIHQEEYSENIST